MTEADLVNREGMERRRFLKAAATVAWATPAIMTLTANRAGAQSCVPLGAPCDACVGVNCCVSAGDPWPCCCSDPDNDQTCDGVCRTHAACEALFPSDDPDLEDPDGCYVAQPFGSSVMARRTSSSSMHKPKFLHKK